MGISEARRALLEARHLYVPAETTVALIAWDDESPEEIEARTAEAEANGDFVVVIRKFRAQPGDPVTQAGPSSLDAVFTAPPEPAHDARIAPLAHADEPRRPEPREMLSAFQEHASEAAEASPGVPWHVCEFSHLTGRCTIYKACGRRSPMWLERERLDREEEARRDQALASTEPSADGPDVLQLGGSEAAITGPVLPPLGAA